MYFHCISHLNYCLSFMMKIMESPAGEHAVGVAHFALMITFKCSPLLDIDQY